MTPCISVFVVSYNTCALLEKCLTSLFDTRNDLTIEVFIADNNSADGSSEMVRTRFPEVLWVRYTRNVGYSRAVNSFLPLAKGQYYLFLHSDLQVLPGTLMRFVQFFESHPQVGIVGGNLYYPDGRPNPCEILFPNFGNELLCFGIRIFRKLPGGSRLMGNHNPMEWSHRSTSRVNWVWNACMMARKEVFQRVGFFDERFFVWYADWDLCKRAIDAGWYIYYLHPAVAIHYERQSFSREGPIRAEVLYKVDGWYSALEQSRDRNTFLRKHLSRMSVFGVKAVYFVENALRLCFVCANFLLVKTAREEASFQIKVCIRKIQTILKT
jgi:N-acetylglucosaminyl-diphospho-decaprenol L-rhamnosyltransferase